MTNEPARERDIVKRLLRKHEQGHPLGDKLVNPDGPEAAAEITRLRELLEAKAPSRRIEIEAETYRQMHEDAKELGYEAILEALEDLERLKNASAR